MALKIYMGYDSREKLAYDVCKYSIFDNSKKCEVIPLVHKQLRVQGYFTRPWLVNAYDGNWTDIIDGKPFSTEFSHTRFLVPALTNYTGWALFMDCDMVVDCDLEKIMEMADHRYAAMVVKHIHKPSEDVKMDGCVQTKYHRKNWSSFILWNCAHPSNKRLTKEYVSTESGTNLHGFSWLKDFEIGALTADYNWIEKVSPAVARPKVVHYTLGGPWFDGYKDVAYADLWWRYYKKMLDNTDLEPITDVIKVNY